MRPATILEGCQAWCGQGGESLKEKTGEFRAVLSNCVSTWLAHQPWKPHGLSAEGADCCHLGPTVRTGHGSPVWSLHFRNCHNWEWFLKALLFYTSSEVHVSCSSLRDCGQKTSAPGCLVAQGLKKWHRDSEWQCSNPVLRHVAYSSALCPFPSLKGHFPSFASQAPQVLFVVLAQAWGCRAKAWHTEGQLHVNQFCPLLCSELLVLIFFFFN